ncbi:M50 family metallopeptidase [Gulosibacter sp. ACHW.36C]|uniref:M50 family metallopeptidase n=1 Tax=Gulosibacter sediminis TaxID=1729695 RepID=A0ABY4N016_9MICO|nr:M50 family metallopeptidase [Gulosibacter sediminis]UQN16037.1 M50 family metallopeptidase [Gulosibacter sediminis]
MEDLPWLDAIVSRIVPPETAPSIDATVLWWVLAAALIACAVPLTWLRVRLGVTLVHELGHAFVGVMVGRKFNGFVLRGDMSGAAVTQGKARGFGRVATTWAGYPAPAILGAALAWFAGRGWAAPTVTLLMLLLVIAMIRVRSWLTAGVTLISLAGFAALWWWRYDEIQALVLIGIAIVLVVGAWRHLGAVVTQPSPSSDPGVLAQLTRVPAFLWNLSFAIVCGLATWGVAQFFLP